jgi:hypothetical protein
MSKNPLCWSGLVSLVAVLLAFSQSVGDPKGRPDPGLIPHVENPASGASVKVHVDPATGRIVPPPRRPAVDAAANARFTSTHEGLTEEPGTTAAGGFKVDLRGKLRSAVFLHTAPGGEPVMTCTDGSNVPSRTAE